MYYTCQVRVLGFVEAQSIYNTGSVDVKRLRIVQLWHSEQGSDLFEKCYLVAL